MYSANFSGFGSRELDFAADLLKEFVNNPPDFLGHKLNIGFNPNSGMVFLFDEDFRTAILDNNRLVQFLTCPNCDTEGIADEDLHLTEDGEHCNHCRP